MAHDFKRRHFRARSSCGPSGGGADTESIAVASQKCWKGAAPTWTAPPPSLGAGLCVGDREAAALAPSARQLVAILARGRNMHQGLMETGVSVPRGRQPWRHHRLPPVADPECKGRQAVPGQGVARLQGVGEALCHQHEQAKRLNNVLEADHGRLKRPIQPTLGFKSMKMACATIQGFEAMRALRKRQAMAFQLQPGHRAKRRVERACGIGPDMMGELMSLHGAERERIAIRLGS